MTIIEFRRGTAAQWAAKNPVLLSGEPGLDTTNLILKVGDGVTAWATLAGVTLTADVGAYGPWTDIPGGQFTAPAIQSVPTAQFRTAPGGQVQLRGQIAFSGIYTPGAAMITFPAGQRPVAGRPMTFSARATGTGAGNTILNLGDSTSGVLSTPLATIVAGTLLNLENVVIYTT